MARQPSVPVPRTASSLLFFATVALALLLVGWWTTFHLWQADELERAGQALLRGDASAVAEALGAQDPAELVVIAHARRRMWISEAVVFGALILTGAALFWWSMLREVRMRQEQDRFLAGATHELKTPLATIQLLLESLRDGRVPAEKQQRWLGSGLLETRRLEHGLTNVLTAAGLRSTGHSTTAALAHRARHGDLADDVREAMAALAPRAEAASVELVCGEVASFETMRDPEGMQLVLRNLLDNAVKYSTHGQRVTVDLSVDGDLARLAVRDAGAGMDAAALAHAFDPFWRGPDPARGGTGLGLHLVRETVRAHGGTVQAASGGPGRGTVIVIELPRREAA